MPDDFLRKGLDKDRAERLKSLLDSVVSSNRGRSEANFSSRAAKLHGKQGEETEHVPFNAFWPTYDTMNQAQTGWYFWWRSRVRAGEYLATDLSYIFIYIYELINNIEERTPVATMRKLFDVWKNYRAQYPRLDRYLVPWIEDYMLINMKLPEQTGPTQREGAEMAAFYDYLCASGADERLINLFPDYAIGRFLAGGLEELPMELLGQLSDYEFYKGKFFLESGCGKEMVKILPRTVSFADDWLVRHGGAGIFEKFKPVSYSKRYRIPFANAVYDGGIKSVELPAPPYIRQLFLRAFITDLFKWTENALRAKTGFKGRLKTGVSDPLLEREVTGFAKAEYDKLIELEKRVTITIDLEKIVRLIDESNAVRMMLLENKQEDEDEQPEALPEQPEVAAPSAGPAMTGELSELQKRLLRFIRDSGGEVSQSAVSAEFGGVLIQLEIDAINEIALETVNDIVLSESDGVWVLEAAYLDRLGL